MTSLLKPPSLSEPPSPISLYFSFENIDRERAIHGCISHDTFFLFLLK